MSRNRGITITLRDLRLAKLEKKQRITPCRTELDAFLAAVARYGDANVPSFIERALAKCMAEDRTSEKQASVKFHLAKFVKRK